MRRLGPPTLPAWIAIIVLSTAATWIVSAHFHATPIANPTDFRAFYCGGRVVEARGDPYRVEPLRRCEEAVLASQRLSWIAGLVVPAPLPPYGLAFFAAFAWLPFGLASSLWFVGSIAAWARTVALMSRMTGMPVPYVGVATFALGLFASINYGQIMPLTMWLIVEASARLRVGDDRSAAILATCSLAEPHIGGPAFVSLFVLRRDARPALAAGLVAVGAISLVALGIPTCFEWLARVLPTHELSELRNPEQFSLTTALSFAGVEASTAVLSGSLMYAILVALGIWTAARLRDRWLEPALVMLAPVAFAVFGGPYVHQHQLAAALPMALVAYAHERRAVYAVAIALLGCAWLSLAESFSAISPAFWPAHEVVVGNVSPADLAEAVWAKFMAALEPGCRELVVATLVKVPLWAGIACVIVPLALEAGARRPAAVSNVSSR